MAEKRSDYSVLFRHEYQKLRSLSARQDLPNEEDWRAIRAEVDRALRELAKYRRMKDSLSVVLQIGGY